MVRVETAHLVELDAGVFLAVGLERREGALARGVEYGLRRLLAGRLLEDLAGVLVSRQDLEDVPGGGDRGVEIPGVEALDGADEKAGSAATTRS